MPFATRHRDDPSSELAPLAALEVHQVWDAEFMARLQSRSAEEMQRRFDAGHRAYVAWWNEDPAAWGWVATRAADIGELGASFAIPDRERYLWNFVTLPSHRRLGVYPRLLQAIVRAESVEAERFWIAYAPENHASGSGIAKAGFTAQAEMSFDPSGRPALRATVPGGGAAASRVLGIRETTEPLTPCWRCVRAGRGAMACAEGRCRCDYQQPKSGCAA
jgi:GNAT superfamily N-acetyltransferase